MKKEDLERVAKNNTFFFRYHHHVLSHRALAREELSVCWREGGSKGTQRSFVTEQSSGTWLVRVTGNCRLQVLLRLEKHTAT